MSPGLRLKLTGVSGLGAIYECDYSVGGRSRSLGTYATMGGAKDALDHFCIVAGQLSLIAPVWLVGSHPHKRDARALGLELRKRAPGAGRNSLGEAAKAQRTFWLSPAGIRAIEAAATSSGRSMGEEIESRFRCQDA